MAVNILLKRSGTPDKRPDPTSMALGELDLNYDAVTGGVFYKDSNGDVVKVGSAQVSATAPNATPVGSAGNSTGEFWYDTANSALKMWDGTTWASTGGGGPSLTGITDTVTTALGTGALDSITDPFVNNTAVGVNAGTALLDGDRNTFVGYQAGQSATGAYSNTFVGHQTGINATEGGNTSVGTSAGPTGAATDSVFVGVDAGSLASGVSNVGVGNSAVGKATGNFNTGIGHIAGQSITSGSSNTLVGRGAGSAITTGSNNTIIGRYGGNTTLTNNFVVSCDTDIKLQINENDALSIGSLGSYGNAGDILMSNGSGAAPTWTTSAGLLPNYGEFLSTATQTNLDTTNGNATTFDTTVLNRNVSVVSNSQITFAQAGVYNIQISMQVTKTDSGTDTFTFWFKKNGVNIDNSTTSLVLGGNSDSHIAALNILESVAANDYIELWWYSPDPNVQLLYVGATAPYPATPSVILTAVPVGA